MNTTHSTSNQYKELNYTMVGGKALNTSEKDDGGLSIILINCGAQSFRTSFFDKLEKLNPVDIITLESAPCPYDVNDLIATHENLRFMIFTGQANTGLRINAAALEILGSHFFVISGQVNISVSHISSVLAHVMSQNQLCLVPLYMDREGQVLPTAMGPVQVADGRFEAQPMIPQSDNTRTLFPWGYDGIYDKKVHNSIGGFDICIHEDWWQLMEYGTRAWLWGEKITIPSDLKVEITDGFSPIDTSVGPGYRRFYFKILAIRRRGNQTCLPWFQWWSYIRKSGDSVFKTISVWKEIRRWVSENGDRYLMDIAGLTALWNWDKDV